MIFKTNPFLASMYFCMYPLIAHSLAKINEAETNSPVKEQDSSDKLEKA